MTDPLKEEAIDLIEDILDKTIEQFVVSIRNEPVYKLMFIPKLIISKMSSEKNIIPDAITILHDNDWYIKFSEYNNVSKETNTIDYKSTYDEILETLVNLFLLQTKGYEYNINYL
jgi:hypothetical protein